MIDKEEFQNLDPDKQAKVFRESSLADKSDLLVYSHEPEKLARSLSLEELYLITKQVDSEERSEILRFAALPQLIFVADLDCWKNDRVNPVGFARWLDSLQKADEKRLFAWLVEADYEAVVAGFKSVARVIKPDWEYARDEALGDEGFFTIDDQYHIYVKQENFEAIKRALELLFENHRGRYVAILEGVLTEMDDLMEEEAYQRRANRLADCGFPAPEVARRIYRPISEKEFLEFPKKSISAKAKETGAVEKPGPHSPVLWQNERLFLDDVLLLFNEEPFEVCEQIQEELAWLSNKVIASEGSDFSSEEKIRQGIERARRQVSMGLEILSHGDFQKAKTLLKERWLETLFRFAINRHYQLQESAKEIVRNFWRGNATALIEFLAEPYGMIFRGVLQQFPQCYDGKVKEHAHFLRDFKNINEIELAGNAVRQVALIHGMLSERLPALFLQLSGSEDETHPVSMTATLATLFAGYVTAKKMTALSLTSNQVKEFLQAAFEKKGRYYFLKAEKKETFLSDLFSGSDLEFLKPLWGVVFQELEEELGGLKDTARLDFRFIQTLKVSSEKIRKKKKASR